MTVGLLYADDGTTETCPTKGILTEKGSGRFGSGSCWFI